MRFPRKPQFDMVRGMARSPRHILIANPGSGKSGGALLSAASREIQVGGWPGLFILAPLQVCLNWRNEVPEWLPNAKVNLITGDKANREAALKESADVYLMNYDNLPWLDKYGPKDWSAFGKMMVCDEATRLRGTRVSWQTSSTGKRWLRTDGGVQTNALARHAADFPFWLNMTATPVPNGPLNWWPLVWYVDGGHRLGNSFSAFEQRWFQVPSRHSDFAKPIPLPGAVEEISARTADITTVVRIEDYIDIARPNIIDRWVELPTNALKQYNDMKQKMFAQIEDGMQTRTISVLSAAAKVARLSQISCLAAGTRVLTSKGVVEIQDIKPGMLVWDGEMWVSQDGCVHKGLRQTMSISGVKLTPDHMVMSTVGWVQAKEINDGSQTNKYDRVEVRGPHGFVSVPCGVGANKPSKVDMCMCVRELLHSTRVKFAEFQSADGKKLWLQTREMERNAWFYWHKTVPYLERGKSTLLRLIEQGLFAIRRVGGENVRRMAKQLSSLCRRHGLDLPRRHDPGSNRRLQGLLERQLQVGEHARATEQPKRQSVAGYSERPHDRSASIAGVRVTGANNSCSHTKTGHECGGRSDTTPTEHREAVFDLLNCGPKNRFAVVDKNGGLLLVHNCGFSYWKDEDEDPDLQQCTHLHDAKVDAVESIIEETGENQIVFYHHQATLDLLKKRFKNRLVELDKAGLAQADWNAGKIEILAIQYQRGSMGLSLQHGGRSMIFIEPTYRADDWEQAIERAGPLRQMQSGYNRAVNVYRVMAHKTLDVSIYEKVQQKMQLQDLMVQLLRGE